MHIVSASRRSDIPAFHARWFAECLRAGFARVSNPFSNKIYEVSLRPEDVIAVVFWTRNPMPLFRHGFKELTDLGIPACFQFTITGYDEILEKSTLSTERALAAFAHAADKVGPEFVQWRYDPIVETSRHDWSWHRRNFERLARSLEGLTRRCTISFVQLYRKTRLRMEAAAAEKDFRYRFREIRPAETARSEFGGAYHVDEMRERTRELAEIAAARGIQLQTCCDDGLIDLDCGIQKAHCIDLELIRSLVRNPDLARRAGPTRDDCGCVESRDIGTYDTCSFGCIYCYAVSSPSGGEGNQVQTLRNGPKMRV